MKIMDNPWFVGISTGIISGILVFFITKWIMDKKGKTEYYKQVNAANNNVINALKPYIADKGLPDIDVFKSLISSTARTFGVNENHMFSVSVYCEELIREIISDVYVSNEKKKEYTESLSDYKKNIALNDRCQNKISVSISPTGIYSETLKRGLSIYISIFTSLVFMLFSLVFSLEKDNAFYDFFWFPFADNPIFWIPLLFLIIIIALLCLIPSKKIIKNSHKKKEDKNSDSDFNKKN